MPEKTWKLDASELKVAQALIDGSKPRTDTLKRLYGQKWSSITSPTEFGMRFKGSVQAGDLRDIEAAGTNTANAQLYSIRGG